MFGEGLSVFVQEDYSMRYVNIWVTEIVGMKQFNISYKDGTLTRIEIPEAVLFGVSGDEPFLRIPKMFSDTFFKVISSFY